MKGFYTIAEVSELLNISTRTAHSYIKKGKLEATKKKNKLYFNKEQFTNKDDSTENTTTKEAQDDLIKEKNERIKELLKDKEYLQKQLNIQSELARNEQVLRKEFQDKFLLLGSGVTQSTEFNDTGASVEVKVNKSKNKTDSKARHNRTKTTTTKRPKQKHNKKKTSKKLQSYSKDDKIKKLRHKKGFFERLFSLK